jgi:N-ATPase, AtpR subunit
MSAWTSSLAGAGNAVWPVLWLAGHLVAGLAIGLAHWQSLRWSIARRPGAARVIVLGAARLAFLAALLFLAAREGAMPLLSTALGVLIARHLAMRQHRARERAS